MWLAGRVYDVVLPFVQQHQPAASRFQFVFSHLFAFSFFPALAVGFMYSEWFRHRVALLVWIVPLVILAYKFATFPSSLFQNHFAVAFHEYFAGGFMIPEFHRYRELFELVIPTRTPGEEWSSCTTRPPSMPRLDTAWGRGSRFAFRFLNRTPRCKA